MQLKCLIGSYESHLYGLNSDFELKFATSVHIGKVTSVAMNKMGFASAGNDESIKCYRGNKLLFTADMDGDVNEIGFSDQYLICTAGRFLVLYKKDELVQELRHMETVVSFAVHPSKRFLLSITKTHLYLFNLLTGKKMVRESLKKYLKASVYPLSIKFDDQGDYFYLLSDRYLLVFKTDDCKCIFTFSSKEIITSISVSDSCYIGLDNGLICEIDIKSKVINKIQAFQNRIKGLQVSKNFSDSDENAVYAVDCKGLVKQFKYSISEEVNVTQLTIPLSFYQGELDFKIQNAKIKELQSHDLKCRVTCFALVEQ